MYQEKDFRNLLKRKSYFIRKSFPQYGHTFASKGISLPQFVQYLLFRGASGGGGGITTCLLSGGRTAPRSKRIIPRRISGQAQIIPIPKVTTVNNRPTIKKMTPRKIRRSLICPPMNYR
jgi:hypothetical protein